jgi:hypothetical protein
MDAGTRSPSWSPGKSPTGPKARSGLLLQLRLRRSDLRETVPVELRLLHDFSRANRGPDVACQAGGGWTTGDDSRDFCLWTFRSDANAHKLVATSTAPRVT